MTLAEGILLLLAILWISGWIATVRDTGPAPGTSKINRAMGVLALFVMWPLIAWGMASRH